MNEKKKTKKLREVANLIAVDLQDFVMVVSDLPDEKVQHLEDAVRLLFRYAKVEASTF